MSETKFELKDGSFNLHKQDPAKKKKESSPDFFGTAKVNNIEYRLSGWGKVSNDGKTYISGYISLPQENTSAPQEAVDDFMTTDKIAAAQQQETGPEQGDPGDSDPLPF